MQGELGDEYVLYLLEDQEEKPVAVILPKDAAEQPLPAVQEVLQLLILCPVSMSLTAYLQTQLMGEKLLEGRATVCCLQIGLSVIFGLATIATTLNANGVLLLQPDQLDLSPSAVLSALPGTLIFLALLGTVLICKLYLSCLSVAEVSHPRDNVRGRPDHRAMADMLHVLLLAVDHTTVWLDAQLLFQSSEASAYPICSTRVCDQSAMKGSNASCKDMFAGVHEAGHAAAAKSRGVELGRPFLIPAGLGFLGGQQDSHRASLCGLPGHCLHLIQR